MQGINTAGQALYLTPTAFSAAVSSPCFDIARSVMPEHRHTWRARSRLSLRSSMKKALFFLFILTLPPRIFALDLELSGGLGNYAFDRERTSALSDPNVEGAFKPQLFPLILARLSGAYKNFAWNAGFERDPLLRNRLLANLKLDLDYFFLELGPFVGIFNSAKLPLNPGISAGLGLVVPGIIFIQAGGSSSLGTVMDIKGNYFQNSGDLAAGFWVPHVICSLNMGVRNFTLREEANVLIEDGLSRYFFRADVFTKNVPFTIRVDLGYQSLRRSYTSEKIETNNLVKDTQTDEFKSIFIGLEGAYTFSPALKFLLGGEMPVYYWGVRPMKDPPKGTFLFEARAGIIWTLPAGNK